VTFLTPCDQCRRGWTPHPSGWFDPCRFCNGTGKLTITRLSKLLETDETTLKRLWRPTGKTRVRTAQHVLDRILTITQPKQTMMFP